MQKFLFLIVLCIAPLAKAVAEDVIQETSQEESPQKESPLEEAPQEQAPQENAPIEEAPIEEEVQNTFEFIRLGDVARANFTTEIKDREPQNSITEFEGRGENLLYFTEFRDFGGQTITHKWIQDEEVISEKTFDVTSNSWRGWSAMAINPENVGELFVEVIDQDGRMVKKDSILILP